MSLSGTPSNSTEYLECIVLFSDGDFSEIGWTSGPVMADIRLPSMYIPPATAAVRQNPWAISPVPP